MKRRPPRPLLQVLPALLGLLAGNAFAASPGMGLGRGRIGIEVQAMTPELRQHFQAPRDRGLLVSRVEPGRPAARAGVTVGDVILEAGGEAQRRTFDWVRVVARAPAGKHLPLRILRKGKARTIVVLPEGSQTPWPDASGIAEWLERGMQMGSEELREQLRILERRLKELEKKIEEEREIRDGAERT